MEYLPYAPLKSIIFRCCGPSWIKLLIGCLSYPTFCFDCFQQDISLVVYSFVGSVLRIWYVDVGSHSSDLEL